MMPLHAQVCPDRADELRWILPGALLGFTGRIGTVPEPLRALLRDHTLDQLRAEPRAIVTRLSAGRSWSVDGARVRTALHSALADPAGWQPAQGDSVRSEDARLLAAAEELLAGRVGQLARSHGGRIELVGVRDGVVQVRLAGACHGCPAAQVTLRVQLEQGLRERCAWLREVSEARSPKQRPNRRCPPSEGTVAVRPLESGVDMG